MCKRNFCLATHNERGQATFVISFVSLFRSFSLRPSPFGHFWVFPVFFFNFFQLILSFLCKETLCKLKRKYGNCSKRARMHAPCVHGPFQAPLTLEFNFLNWCRVSYVRTDYVSWKEKSKKLSKRACTHAPCVHGPFQAPLTLEFNFLNWCRVSYVRTDYVSWKEKSKNLSKRACTHAPCVHGPLHRPLT